MSITTLLNDNEYTALKILKEEIVKQYRILDMRLYGSKARGQSNSESDIDIMIELEEHDSEIESAIDDMIFKINLEYDVFISAIFFSRKMIVYGPMSESPIYKVIQKEGIPL
ncbi:MAG: hypothetical protein A2W19_03200 [Spirochaetes bacterium RBG_16_49_21]|nr:MAG: hypothetical protein A2W19_03200 [Spirochaetes bacterium RBG_16_49_21]